MIRRKHEQRSAARLRLYLLLAAILLGSLVFVLYFTHSVRVDIEMPKSKLSVESAHFSATEEMNDKTIFKPNEQLLGRVSHAQSETSKLPPVPQSQQKPSTSIGLDHEVKRRQLLDSSIHFIHVPKCGGTTMTAVLREIQCFRDSSLNKDCCLNPGFCDWHAHRRCGSIKGCINHFPNRKSIFKTIPSVTVLREPISRILSAWFYRGHSPNLDFFQVRPEFKEIKEGKRPRVTFSEYIDMPEYQNIQTRMLGSDSFPYRNITITEEVFAAAKDALHHLFFVGLQEEFDLSVNALIREMNLTMIPTLKKERDQSNKQISSQKAELRSNEALMARARANNEYDLRLYDEACAMFCETIRDYPDLEEKVNKRGKIDCANHKQ